MKLNIVVGYDFSSMADGALSFANDLAQATGGSLQISHVLLLPTPVSEAALPIPYPDPDEIERVRRKIGETLATRRIDAGVTVSLGINAGEAVCQTARDLKSNLIVLGTHGRGGFRRAVLGSVADYVVRHADCPVTTIRQNRSLSVPFE